MCIALELPFAFVGAKRRDRPVKRNCRGVEGQNAGDKGEGKREKERGREKERTQSRSAGARSRGNSICDARHACRGKRVAILLPA